MSTAQPEAAPTSPRTDAQTSCTSIASVAPFDRSDADIILRSSDKVNFRCHRLILSIASSFFADMFSLPQPLDYSSTDNIVTVDVDEVSETMHPLLTICYPLEEPKLLTVDVARAVLDAALKYDIPKALTFITRILLSFVPAEPLRVYAIACRTGLEELARTAAHEAVSRSIISYQHFSELEEMPAGCYYRLLQLRADRKKCLSFCKPDKTVDVTIVLKGVKRNASFPFDAEDGDGIIAASDGVQFRVYKSIIALISPVLNAMLESSFNTFKHEGILGNGKSFPGVVSVQVEESSTVLEPLLQLCYPIGLSDSDNIDMLSMLRAAEKYKMSRAIHLIRKRWPEFITSRPLDAYMAAASRGWKEEAIQATRSLFTRTISELEAMYSHELETCSANIYVSLLRYHRACTDAVEKAGQSVQSWIPQNAVQLFRTSGGCVVTTTNPPAWLNDSVRQAVNVLQARPSALLTVTGQVVDIFVEKGIPYCDSYYRTGAATQIINACHSLGKTLDEKLAKITLEL